MVDHVETARIAGVDIEIDAIRLTIEKDWRNLEPAASICFGLRAMLPGMNFKFQRVFWIQLSWMIMVIPTPSGMAWRHL